MKSCQDEHDEALQAMNEWASASVGIQGFAVVEPLNDSDGQEPQPEGYAQQMADAFDKEKKAQQNYYDKLRAWLDCIKGKAILKPGRHN